MSVIDPWHYTGSSYWHTHEKSSSFTDLCKKILPKKYIDIDIGLTGYIKCNSDIILENQEVYCEDIMGRTVIFLSDYLIFQRYTEGDILIKTKDGERYYMLSDDEIDKLIETVKGKNNY